MKTNNIQVHKFEIMKLLSIAGMIRYEQLCKLIDLNPDTLHSVLNQLHKSGKLIRKANCIGIDKDAIDNPDPQRTAAMWVFCDFIKRCEYYTAGEFPALVCFFADGNEYEILYASDGQENIICKAVDGGDEPPIRLIIIDTMEQIEKLPVPNTAAYCMVGRDGKVQYFKRSQQ